MNARRMVLYLILNAAVSASATLAVLWWWDRTHPSPPAIVAGSVSATPSTGGPGASPAPATEPLASTATPTVYVVRSGDTLGSIAQQFDVSVEEIMAAN